LSNNFITESIDPDAVLFGLARIGGLIARSFIGK
jgi:hypothetical protein